MLAVGVLAAAGVTLPSDVAGAAQSTYAVSGVDVGRALGVTVTSKNDDALAEVRSPATAAAVSTVLVVVAHPDDEALGFAGVIESAVAQGRPVYVAVVTNGDASQSGSDSGYCGASSGSPATTAHYGLRRDGETLAAMSLLGLVRTSDSATTRVFFLGYPDGGLQTIASSGAGWTGDASGLHRTYAEDGDGSNSSCNGDLHYQLSGVHAPLSASGLSGDLDSLIALTRPADVYTNAAFDGHPDHATLHQLVVDAVQRSGLTPVVHSTLMHPSGSGSCMAQSAYMWPNPSDPTGVNPNGRFAPTLDVTAPPTPVCSSSPTGQSWGSAGPPSELVAVPADMRSTDPSTNKKWQVISQYASQINCTVNPDGTYQASCGYMRAFVKAHEFFWTETVAQPPPPANTSLPVISGSAVAGQVLSASTGVWTGNPSGYSYEWRRCDATGAGCVAIGGATSAGYTLAAADVGATVRVAVTASNGGGSATAVSVQTAVVTAAVAGGSFGQSQVGTLVDTGGAGYLDLSGPYTVSAAVSVSQLNGYIAGSSAASRIRGVIYTNNSGQPGTLVAVTSEVSVAANRAAGWLVLPLASPVQLAAGSYWLGYWYADGNSRLYYLNVAGAERYKAAAYSATGNPPTSFGTSSTAASSYSLTASFVPAGSPPANTSLPVISGSTISGQLLSASTGVWSGSPTGYAHEWRRCDATGAGCVAIAGATGSGYTLVSADVGSTIRVAVTASNSAGSTTAVSAQTAVVTSPQPPANTSLPVISGSPVAGQVLSASTGVWSGGPTGYAYEWRRCDPTGAGCVAIAGASGSSYTLAAADVGSTLRVAVTASNAAGSTTAVSVQTAMVTSPQPPTNTSLPTISGSPVNGQPLSASTGVWTGNPTGYSYEWRRCDTTGAGCVAIVGATGVGLHTGRRRCRFHAAGSGDRKQRCRQHHRGVSPDRGRHLAAAAYKHEPANDQRQSGQRAAVERVSPASGRAAPPATPTNGAAATHRRGLHRHLRRYQRHLHPHRRRPRLHAAGSGDSKQRCRQHHRRLHPDRGRERAGAVCFRPSQHRAWPVRAGHRGERRRRHQRGRVPGCCRRR